MRPRLVFYAEILILFVLVNVYGFAQSQIPDSPAGHALQAWLEAFNSGDRAKVEAYAKTYNPHESVERTLGFRNQTGGFELLGIDSSEPLSISFRVKEKSSSNVAAGSLQVNDGQPPVVQNFDLHLLPPGAVIEKVKLDSETRERIIDGIEKSLTEFYIYPDTAQKMVEALRGKQKKGDFNATTDSNQFAYLLTKTLEDVSHDKHLRVNFSPVKLPPDEGGPKPQDELRFRKMLQQTNCGFEKVEILPQNIGYLKFNMFADTDTCGPTAVAAMNFLAHADAVVLDLRGNGGGRPEMVALIASYLFDKPTHLNDLYNRKEDTTTQYWTLPFVSGERMPKTPVFVLTSKETFSGAEEFAYDLQNLKRATIVGETTGGGAHPVAGHRVDDHFMIGVPFARAINPITKTNWEGTGVKPDIPVDASQALETAERLALSKPHSE